MAIKASRNDVWMAVIDDRAGGAAEKLEALAKSGADLEIVFARRTPEHPGQGILFAGPIALGFPLRHDRRRDLGRRHAVALAQRLHDALDLAPVEAHVEALHRIAPEIEGHARVDAAELDPRVVAAPLGRARRPLERPA